VEEALLFDVFADPLEVENRALEEADEVVRLSAILLPRLAEAREAESALRGL
jgi:hypothetical protein